MNQKFSKVGRLTSPSNLSICVISGKFPFEIKLKTTPLLYYILFFKKLFKCRIKKNKLSTRGNQSKL